ncbi:Putative disease resistance protein RGA4 [Morus notabilis]|uniref:Putative disease resistance protein RGA4 n=2 Tax=Morus notabilis TaxID=981085 RepID=W9RT40_9ROSA|nr:Putative disease resistance protein RGA4 [Morus notabilis]
MAADIPSMIIVLKQMSELVGSEAMKERALDDCLKLESIISDLIFVLQRVQQQPYMNLERVEDAVYEAYDFLDDCLAVVSSGRRRRRVASPNKNINIATKVGSFFSLASSNPIVFRHNMGYATKKLRKALQRSVALTNIRVHADVIRAAYLFAEAGKQLPSYPHVKDENIIGRDLDKGQIMKLVLEAADIESTEQNPRVVPVVGFKGIGKTTLARLVYQEPVVRECFDLRMWVCVEDRFDVRFIVLGLMGSVERERLDYLQMDQLQKELRKTINGKRFFVVLDDVRDISRESWLSLRNLLVGGAEGSTVLVTTRSEKVANIARTVAQSYHLGRLNNADSRLLLKRAAFHTNDGEEEVQAFEEIGRQIAAKCEGVPLVIWCVGSSLRLKGVDEWQSFDAKEEIARVRRKYDEESDNKQTKVASGMRETHSFVPQEEIIGRDADKEAIMEQLLAHSSEENELMVIAIVGAAGLGKTALAQLIFNDSRVQDHFDLSIWVCVTEDFDLKKIMMNIIVSVTSKDPGYPELEELARDIHQEILGKRYLLILDDAWNEDHEKWSRLLSFLSSGANGSRVIVTTRNENVVVNLASEKHTHRLKSLDEASSWSLFVKTAFEKGQQPTNSNIIKIGKDIVANCGGMPLAIKTIGGRLYFKNSETEWQSFYEKELPKILNTGADMLASLMLSYDDLPYFLKACFFYCGLFPKDYEIDVQTLVNLWMSLGFIIKPNPDLNLEDVGYGYFVDLLRRSFFQETMRDEQGRITKCKMQNSMCDLARSVAQNVCATIGIKGGINGAKSRHVSFDFHLDSSWHIRLLAQSKRIQSLILPTQLRQEVEGRSSESVCEEVTKFKYLRMLDLHNSGIKVVSDSIGDLKHLRYLDLSQNLNIKALPNSIGKLHHLQTLKLNHCSNLQKLPGAIRKLVNLRNLENESCYCLTHMPQRLSQLSNLQTLSEFVLSKGICSASNQSAKLDELAELNELRGKLKIKNLSCLGGDETTRARLKEKQYLLSLILIWDIDAVNVESDYEKLLEDLQPHPNLRELSLSAYGGVRFSSWLPQHENLVKFSLSRCRKCQCLPPLHRLPRLEVLLVDELPELEYISDKNESGAFFQSLKELQLTNLPKLARWWKRAAGDEKTTFSRLSKLIIKDCPSLISMPLFPCLEELLVLKNTRGEPFQETIAARRIPSTTSEASSSTSSTTVPPSVPLSKLRTLCLINMPNGGPKMWQSLSSLRSVTLDHLQDIKTLLEGLEQVTNLQELHVWRCDSLEEISWLSKIRSLRILSLRLCPNLTIPRDRISLITSLQKVEIEECPRISHIERMLEDRLYRQ